MAERESPDEYRARIRALVERSGNKRCMLCGFNRFMGTIHPYAGVNAPSRDKTKWCTGTAVLPPKIALVGQAAFCCPKCHRTSFLTNEKWELANLAEKCFQCTLPPEGESDV